MLVNREKAHPSVFNVLLQLLDDGRLTDSKGNTVNFKNCVVIFTSNIGSEAILRMNATKSSEINNVVISALKSQFRPEFLNRMDEFVIFNPLGETELKSIVKLEIKKVESRLRERDINLDITDSALEWLVRSGFDQMYGARPLKRTIQKEVETPIAREILAGSFGKHTKVFIDYAAGDSTLLIRGSSQVPEEKA